MALPTRLSDRRRVVQGLGRKMSWKNSCARVETGLVVATLVGRKGSAVAVKMFCPWNRFNEGIPQSTVLEIRFGT